MRWSRVSSFAGILLAAAASVATSAPPPDWTRDDSASGETTLAPDVEETIVRVKATSRAVASGISVRVALDPAPARSADVADAPIVLFVAVAEPNSDGGSAPPSSHLVAVPNSGVSADGFDPAGSAEVPSGSEARVFELHFAWTSPNPRDLMSSRYVESSRQFVEVERPLAPRQPTKIRWRASIHAEGFDDAPAGATVMVEAAP